jgi:uncharacterized SAM-binding protein YcdF (DUF218 family)
VTRATAKPSSALAPPLLDAVRTLWDYHDLRHTPRRSEVAIGLGSHDLGVATRAADLYLTGLVPLIVFTGANAPTTTGVFPRGEAVHYREHALTRGVPDDAILIEPTARNTGENITRTRELLHQQGVVVRSAILVSRPYQQRRAWATCRQLWPEIDIRCTSLPQTLDDYLGTAADADFVVNMLVGDTQRIDTYAERGFAIPQPMPDAVRHAFRVLREAGYTRRLT